MKRNQRSRIQLGLMQRYGTPAKGASSLIRATPLVPPSPDACMQDGQSQTSTITSLSRSGGLSGNGSRIETRGSIEITIPEACICSGVKSENSGTSLRSEYRNTVPGDLNRTCSEESLESDLSMNVPSVTSTTRALSINPTSLNTPMHNSFVSSSIHLPSTSAISSELANLLSPSELENVQPLARDADEQTRLLDKSSQSIRLSADSIDGSRHSMPDLLVGCTEVASFDSVKQPKGRRKYLP
jgi:hypothetical protein